MKVNTSIALKLYAYGINKLHDPNWTGMELFEYLKQHVRGRVEPKNMLYETIPDGLLYHIGKWIYEEYFEFFEMYDKEDSALFPVEGEYLLWYIEDYIDLIISCGANESGKLLNATNKVLDKYDKLYEKDEVLYLRTLNKHSDSLKLNVYRLYEEYSDKISAAKDLYSRAFAERAFHDRELCEFIINIVIFIGFDGSTDDGDPKKWIERDYLPAWAQNAIKVRDRGHCAECGKQIILEIDDKYHFDHIIPLFQGGNNDIANFQLSCAKCNLQKNAKLIPVKSSIPEYLKHARKKR